MTTAPAAPHGGVASKNIDDSHIEKSRKKTKRERDAEEVGNGGKMELPEGSNGKP